MSKPTPVAGTHRRKPHETAPRRRASRPVVLITDSETAAGAAIARAVSSADMTCVLHYRDDGSRSLSEAVLDCLCDRGRARTSRVPTAVA